MICNKLVSVVHYDSIFLLLKKWTESLVVGFLLNPLELGKCVYAAGCEHSKCGKGGGGMRSGRAWTARGRSSVLTWHGLR